MALIKYKPRTPGTRAVVKVDRSHLFKGGPRLDLTAHQSKTGGRNHFGRITTRHHGGGTRQKYRLIDFKRAWSTTRTAPVTSRSSSIPTASGATFSRPRA